MKIARVILFPAVLLVAFLLGWGYLHFVRDPWVRKVAALEADKQTLDSSLRVMEARDRDRAKRDTVFIRRIIQAKARVDTVEIAAKAATDSFVVVLPDSLKAPFLAVIALKDSAIAGLKLIVANQERMIALRDTALTETHANLIDALRQRDDYRSLSHPSFIVRLFRELPVIGATAGITAVAVVVLKN